LETRLARRFAVRHRYLLLLTTLLLSVAVALPGFAQPSHSAPPNQGNAEAGMPVIESYNARAYNGFPQIWTILQDRRGIMYFGNSGGEILEYDGVTWRKITTANIVRSLAIDDDGKIWFGSNANFGYLSPDAAGTLKFVSLLDKIPAEQRNFTDVWQILITPQGVFFRSYEHLFRWDGKQMQVWSPAAKSRFQALSAVHGHIYTSQEGIGLQEIVGDELRNVPGGDGYRDSIKLFLHPYDAQHILVSARNGLFTLYDGEKVTPFPTPVDDYFLKYKLYTSTILADGSICATTLGGGVVILEHDGKLRQIIDKDAGLLTSETLSAYQDREGALWVGMEDGVSRVEVESPISIFSRSGSFDVLRFQGTIYASGVESNSAVSRLVSDPKTGRPSFVPLHGPGQGWTLLVFKDPEGKTPDQLLAATSEGVMRVEGDNLVPAMPVVHGLPEQNYFLLQSRKTPARVFIGHSDGISSMRWDGRTWIDEGRLPGTLYEARSLAEDGEGTLWAAGADGKVLRVEVAPSGMHDAKFQELGAREGLPAGITDVEFVAGSTFVTLGRTQHIYRWDAAGHKFVVDDRFLLPVDSTDATPYLFPALNGNFWSISFSYDNRRVALFSRQSDGSWHAEEDAYRRLDRYRTLFLRSEPDGVVWAPGEYVLRFTPEKNTASPQPFPTLVRQVNAGSQVVFGGTSTAGAPGYWFAV
jgi:hypothetical protein